MYSFVMTMFCMFVFCSVVRLLSVLVNDYPRTKEENLSTEVVSFNINLVFTVWAAWLLWWQ